MKLLCKIFGHSWYFRRNEHIGPNIKTYYACNRCVMGVKSVTVPSNMEL